MGYSGCSSLESMPIPVARRSTWLCSQLCQDPRILKDCYRKIWKKDLGQTKNSDFHLSSKFELGHQVLWEAFPDFLDHALNDYCSQYHVVPNFPLLLLRCAHSGWRLCLPCLRCTAGDRRPGTPLRAQSVRTLSSCEQVPVSVCTCLSGALHSSCLFSHLLVYMDDLALFGIFFFPPSLPSFFFVENNFFFFLFNSEN